MLIARDALELIFVGYNAHAPNPCSDASFFIPAKGFVSSGEKKLQRHSDYCNPALQKHCFFITEFVCGALTMENIAYSDSTKMLENDNVLRMLTRSTFAHTRNSAGFTIHCLVAVSRKVLQNTLGSLTRNLGGRCRRTRKSMNPRLNLWLFLRFLLGRL